MKLSNFKKAILAQIIANILWGMGPPIFKWSFTNVHFMTLAFLRFAVPAAIIGLCFNKGITLHKKHIWLLLLVGILDISLNIAFFFIGILYTASINVSIIMAASPIFLIFGSMFLLHEKPTKKLLLGNMVGLTGILLIILEPLFNTSEHSSIFGNFLLLLAALCSVTGTIVSKKIIKEYTPMALTFWSFVVGALSFFPFFFHDSLTYGFLSGITYKGIIGVLFGVFCASLFAYYLYYYSLKYMYASQTGVFSYLDPIATIALAAPLLGEFPSFLFLIGSMLVFGGIYMAEKKINYHPLHYLLRREERPVYSS